MLNQATRVHRVFHALGDPTRRAIVEKLSYGPASVSSLAGPLAITVAAVLLTISLGFSISLNYFRCSTFNEFEQRK